nr:DUF6660 family protein [Aquimarina sp. I32.4]
MALNLMPCNDTISTTEDTHIETSTCTGDTHDDSTENDLCSPFCQCHCCHVHVVDFNINSYQLLLPEMYPQLFTHFDSVGKEIPDLPFQPPKV